MSNYDPERQTDRRDPDVKTRATDETDESRDFIRQRKAYRRWTIFYATFSAGLIALFFNGLYDNGAASRAQKGCHIAQTIGVQGYLSADRIVNETENGEARERQKITRAEYAKTVPKTDQTPLGTADTCEQQFPKKTYIIF